MSKTERKGARSILDVGCQLDTAVEEKGGDLVKAVGQNPGLIAQMAALALGTTAEAVDLAMSWQFQLMALIIAMGKFTSGVNPNITAVNFPFTATDLVGLFQRAMSIKLVTITHLDYEPETPEVRQIIKEKGLRPANLLEILIWWLFHTGDCLVVALGSEWRGFVPFVRQDGSARLLPLRTVAPTWTRDCTFAAVSETIE